MKKIQTIDIRRHITQVWRRFLILLQVAAGILSATFLTGCGDRYVRSPELRELYAEVDEEIERAGQYMDQREHRISTLKTDLSRTSDPQRRLALSKLLAGEYSSYKSDSALKYVTVAGNLASMLGDPEEVNRSRISKADIASHAGLFSEAREMLDSIDRSRLDTLELQRMYGVYSALYQYESEYLPDGEYAANAMNLRKLYVDSLLSLSLHHSFDYIINRAFRDMQEQKHEKVIGDISSALDHYRSGDRHYSILASTLANAYRESGDIANYRKYLAITVISDIKGATKENMAIRDLATQAFDEGDIERANHYVKVSLDDANFYASRMQNAQSGRILPVIDKAYDRQQKKLRDRLKSSLCVMAILLVAFIIAIAFIARQWRSVEEANRKVQRSNEELQGLSDRLHEANHALEDINSALEKSNSALAGSNARIKRSARIAEEYTGLFMEYSSLNIALLEKYHTALRNLAVQGNVKGILRKLDSDEIVNETLRAFYSKFDDAVLSIYPTFVDDVNGLLKPDGRIVLKPGEKLNTELRVLAVMRLGILDADKIARFLRCSVSTVYTYRSRLKRRAENPDEFEQRVISAPREEE